MNGYRLVTKDSETRAWIACVRELEREAAGTRLERAGAREQHPREGRGR